MVTPMQQEGAQARGPNGELATFRGGQWVVEQAAPAQGSGWQVQPMTSPSDARADQRLNLAEDSAARSARSEERSVDQQAQTQQRQGMQFEVDLRKEFQALPDVKDYQAIRSSYENVRSTAQNDSAAGDLSLIFAFMKILDPSSVVREQEFANAQNAAGIPDQVRNAYNRALNGERLSPRQRADFLTQAGSIFQNRTQAYNQAAERYRTLADEYGAAPDRVALLAEAPAAVEIPQAPSQQEQREGVAPAALPVDADGVADWNSLTADQRMSIRAGQKVRAPSGEIVTASGQPFTSNTREGDRQGGDGLNLREPNLMDSVGAFATAAGEQIPGLDEAAVAADAALSGQSYSDARAEYNDMKTVLNQTDRGARVAGGIAGAVATVAAPGGLASGRYIAAAPSMIGAAARGAGVGAMTGAVYGAGAADGGLGERIQGAQDGALVGAMTGGALAGGANAIGQATRGVSMTGGQRAADVQTLTDNGVFLTPGQRMGGMAMTAENLAQRAPIVGTAIRGARQRGVDTLNRAVGNRALDAIGEGVPADIPAGGDMVARVGDRLGQEFERAYAMVPQFAPDQQLQDGLSTIAQTKADLPPQMGDQFDNILASRLGRLDGASGAQVGAIRSEIAGLAAQYARSGDVAQQGLGQMLMGVADELDGAIGRASPEAGGILTSARDGWGDYVRMERASTAAAGRPFSPSQFEGAVRTSDGSVRKGAVGRNEARMQDLSRAATSVMRDQFGNPGTADAIGAGALATGAVTAPLTTAAVAGGLTAAATPYFMMGRKVLDRLPSNASRQQVEAAAGELSELARQDPNVIQLTDELRRLYQGSAAVAGGNQAEPRRLMTGGR